ncbi:MAG: serpin family protein [Verrucomicrobia bacterium]|nr:serpin family protein [Verrucomicrobiota bacterium]
MKRISLHALLVAFTLPLLRAQAPTSPAILTVANDAAWRAPAATLDLTQARVRPATARLSNVSIRARAGTGDNTLIAGAVLQGTGTLPMVVRAIGPGLTRFGLAEALRSPRLEIFNGDVSAASTNAAGAPATAASAYVGAFAPVESTGGLATGDAVLTGQPAAGTITAHCSSAVGAAGVALLEFYDASAAPTTTSARFINLSSRARVEAGDGLIVIGFVVAGEGNATLLLRAAGPSLAPFGVTGLLADPRIELYSGGTLVASNDDWSAGDATTVARVRDAATAAGAFALTSASDAALLVTLPAGNYTLHVRGAGAQSGVALAEIHQIALENFDAAVAMNNVGLDVYRELARTRANQNLIISPYSIESALALVYAGADGDTRTEMARVLRLPETDTTLQAGFASLRTGLRATADASKAVADARTRSGSRTDPIDWNEANRLFGQQNHPFRDAFLSLMRDGFAAPLQLLDFTTNFEAARLTINSWVEEQTRQKIKNLIPSGGVTSDTRLVLVNALYLKAPWDTPFEKFATSPRTFRVASDSSPSVPTMQRTAFMGYAKEDNLSVVTLDYLNAGLQFIVMLPDSGVTPDAVATQLTPSHFSRWASLRTTGRRQVSLFLPKFTVPGLTVPLRTTLEALGLRRAFDSPPGSANFDRLAPREAGALAISNVYHQTYVALDEEGTEAAAATAVVAGTTTSAPINPTLPIEVRVDRPFLFAIQHRDTGALLFLGKIADPR